ncbi:MrpH family fimbial adhesin [Serratia ureilytica]|uniref:MrpH family fimbial adhesin n=1 Tax=Serratia ureilytica TaxID=300181 RepID=UPI001D18C04A|nr:hypothetical protein [Serratia ureilytica]MCC4106648.1 hypothetical protein [Serratia ureilytica]
MLKRLLTLSALFLISSFSAYGGGIYSYISKSTILPDGISFIYDYTIESWDEDIDIPNPCYGTRDCFVYITHKHSDNWDAGQQGFEGYTIDSRNLKTVGELGREYKKKRPLPYSGNLGHGDTNKKVSAECVAIYYIRDHSQDRKVMPGMICGVAPPPAGICGFTNMSDITLDHGPVSASAQHDPRTVNIGVSCSRPTPLKLYVKTGSNGRLDLNGPGSGVYSTLRLNKVPADQGLDLQQVGPSGVNVSLSSELHTNVSSTAGNYAGSAIVILAVY